MSDSLHFRNLNFHSHPAVAPELPPSRLATDMVAVTAIKTGLLPIKNPTMANNKVYFTGTMGEYSDRERKFLEGVDLAFIITYFTKPLTNTRSLLSSFSSTWFTRGLDPFLAYLTLSR